jgi:YidC/Oxa1 family membrane protein insertase
MAEPENGGNSNPQAPKQMSMEVRLLLAFILMGVVVFLTPYFVKTPPPTRKAATTAAQQTTSTTPASTTPAPAPTPAAETPAAEVPSIPVAGATPQQPQPPFIVDTKLFRVVLNNQGATVRSWQVKKFKDSNGKPLDLVNTASGLEFPFSLRFPGAQPTSPVNWKFFQQTPDADGMGVTFTYSDGHTAVRKVFHFQANSYLAQVETQATLDDKPLPNEIQWLGGFGDLTVGNPAIAGRAIYFNLTEGKLTEHYAKSGNASAEGDFSFAGLVDAYFAAVFLPEGSSKVRLDMFANGVPTPKDPKAAQEIGMALGDGAVNRFRMFVGPKDYYLLKSVDPKLEQVVDFGWFSFMAKPLFLLVNYFNSAFMHNFGWAIVLVTLAINMALFPLRLSNMKSMRKMQALKPQIDAINAKYKNVGLRDPKKQDQNQEVMDLYKRYGVNPMGGCFPMLIQLPFFYAFYKVFTVSVEMRGASWLWVPDLSLPEPWPIKVLPIIMIVTQFYMQSMTPQPNTDPSQQKMMKLMPLIFGFMFYQFPSGLVLYYLTSNLVNMGQQWFFNHTETAQEAARSVELPKKKDGRK